ncbi:hypothetical protein KKI45_00185 (plasmid) [Levilactobacillus brevis]|uniref:hypothetical protein n=1 Tax=Levilactobacillus brevis TaxID=1580 RepID=UPI000FF42862|nr:hypothetical protein [Levilactobacillus brevis]QWK86553.1 hypothetical protein KKI45_00185 [Levilactobacillus brevis]RRG07300.1 MAG: hypothetical protein DUD30_01170 [Lactobacillus sp.]
MSKTGKITIDVEKGQPVNIDGGVFDADEMVTYTVYAIASTIHQLGGNPRTFIEDMLDTIEGNTSDTEGE